MPYFLDCKLGLVLSDLVIPFRTTSSHTEHYILLSFSSWVPLSNYLAVVELNPNEQKGGMTLWIGCAVANPAIFFTINTP